MAAPNVPIDKELFALLEEAKVALTFYAGRDVNPSRARQAERIVDHLDKYLVLKMVKFPEFTARPFDA